MNIPSQPDQELEQRLASPLLDALIRAGLILAMAMLCYRIFSPFLTLMVWALILAVTIYPLHQSLAGKIGGKQGFAATVLVVVGVVLMGWVAANPNAGQAQAKSDARSAS
jgi:predicted PurR-regulated permease PerM